MISAEPSLKHSPTKWCNERNWLHLWHYWYDTYTSTCIWYNICDFFLTLGNIIGFDSPTCLWKWGLPPCRFCTCRCDILSHFHDNSWHLWHFCDIDWHHCFFYSTIRFMRSFMQVRFAPYRFCMCHDLCNIFSHFFDICVIFVTLLWWHFDSPIRFMRSFMQVKFAHIQISYVSIASSPPIMWKPGAHLFVSDISYIVFYETYIMHHIHFFLCGIYHTRSLEALWALTSVFLALWSSLTSVF